MCLTDSLRLKGTTSFNILVNWKIQPDSRLWGGFKNSFAHLVSVFLINLDHRKAFSYLNCVDVSCVNGVFRGFVPCEQMTAVTANEVTSPLQQLQHVVTTRKVSSSKSLCLFVWVSFMLSSQLKMWCVIKAADLKQCSPQQALWLTDIELYSLLRCVVFIAFCNENPTLMLHRGWGMFRGLHTLGHVKLENQTGGHFKQGLVDYRFFVG